VSAARSSLPPTVGSASITRGSPNQNSHQVLSFTGWHADGAPFAMVTAPFDDDPVLRAGQLARDIIAAYAGALLERRAEPYARLVRAVAGAIA
jgi:hypothetical protein